jgi:hypothetical protein
MDKKKILIVTNGFYPENSPRSLRATELAKEFACKGHSVKVITHYREGVKDFCKNQRIEFKDLGALTWPVPVIHGKGLIRLFWRAVVRLSSLLFEYPLLQIAPLVRKELKGEKEYDLLISVAVPYPIHWGVAAARNKKNEIAKIWVADCGDPFMGLENDTFKRPFYFGWIERWFCRKADYISIPFEGAMDAYYREFHGKIKIIPQGLSFPNLIPKAQRNQIIHFAYAGNIVSYLHYALPFFRYLNTLEIDFKFHIYTIDKHIYTDNLNVKTLKKCTFHNYKDRMILLEELNEVDFLLHFPYQKESQKSLKLVDYFFLNKPIISFNNDERSYERLIQFLNFDFKDQMKRETVEKYRIENVVKQFISLLEQ